MEHRELIDELRMAPLEIGSLQQNRAGARESVQATGEAAPLVIQQENTRVQIAEDVVGLLIQRPRSAMGAAAIRI